ncbi:MAG TPA: hypothetical protein GXX73_06460 [Clostridium sp.]|uniref:Uncharacterized protein n=2 Tax=Acetivibrio mesophilus TaxID=2487273 RepID=A0A4Q0I4J0_9FIRM|nr:hypothetical protein A7W90_06990 [Clostridium sp. Bc-iso-3]RXE59223.1 hypothetical protein EFD62_08695 [Acetivibrio mesophilus]HHV29227.1 hypothetical protein [Clostridium sp.]
MEYMFYYFSLFGVLVSLIICLYFKSFDFKSSIIGIVTVAFSMVYETVLGGYFGLYYYLNPKDSIIYMVLSAILLYPALNIIYTMFLPKKKKAILGYTATWMIAMLIFEYFSVISGTVVFTGWKPFPWSVVTYIVTYLWVYLIYRYLSNKRLSLKLS